MSGHVSSVIATVGLVLLAAAVGAGLCLAAHVSADRDAPVACSATEAGPLFDCESGEPLRYADGKWFR
jgi:hypothetical protein